MNWLLSRLKHPSMARFYGFRGPWGLNFLSQADGRRILLVSRHPSWSITWLWFVCIGPGCDGKRIGISVWRRRSYVLNLWRFHFGIKMQQAMAKRPGSYGYNRKRWQQYCAKIARRHARWAYEAEYRRKLAAMHEGNHD